MPETVMIRVGSHRARKRLATAGIEGDAMFSFERHATGGFLLIPADRIEEACAITGVTQTIDRGDFLFCWPSRRTPETP